MHIHLLAADPGMNCGLASGVFDTDTKKLGRIAHTTILFPRDFSDTQNGYACMRAVEEVYDWWMKEIEVAERIDRPVFAAEVFRLRPGARGSKPESLSAVWVHAMLVQRFMMFFKDDLHLLRYTPGTAKGTITDGRLRKLGMWWPGVQHERDAARILELARRRLVHG